MYHNKKNESLFLNSWFMTKMASIIVCVTENTDEWSDSKNE